MPRTGKTPKTECDQKLTAIGEIGTVAEWNARCPVGTRVLHHLAHESVEGIPPVEGVTRSLAWDRSISVQELYGSRPVVALAGKTGGVPLARLQVFIEPPPLSETRN